MNKVSIKKRIVTTLIMAICMSFCMSLVMTLVNVGPANFVLVMWLRSWLIGFIVALPLAFFLPPAIQKIATKLEL